MDSHPNPYEPPRSDLDPIRGSAPSLRGFDDASLATFQFILSDQWFQATQRRASQAAGERRLFWQLIAIVFSLAVIVTFSFRLPPKIVPTILLGTVIIAPVVFIPIAVSSRARQDALQQFRRWKTYHDTVTVTLYRDGLLSQTSLTSAALRWETFSSAVRFSDGFFLTADAQKFWLYIVDMTSGRIDDVDAILRANIPNYKEMRN